MSAADVNASRSRVVPASREGPSFPLSSKLMATALVVLLLVWAARVAEPVVAAGMSVGSAVCLAGVFGVVGATYAAMLRSRTAIDEKQIRQSWLWTRQVVLADITQLKLIDLPGLSWLVAPRLVVRVRGRLGVYTFHAAGPQVVAAFRDLAQGRAPGMQC